LQAGETGGVARRHGLAESLLFTWRRQARQGRLGGETVTTIGFRMLYRFVIIRLDRRDLVWINVTDHPMAKWLAHQITEAFPWNGAPGYIIRDRDRIYGAVVTRRLRALGIRDKPIAPASPWQNGVAERLIGSIRRECVDHVIVWASTLCRILKS
jgi:hypothetical protein